MMCRLLKVSTSGYYAFLKRPPSQRLLRDQVMALRICEIHRENRGRYGCPRVFRELKAEGARISRKRVARLMKQEGLAGKKKRRFIATTVSLPNAAFAPNLLNRDFNPPALNRAWVTDVTAIWTLEGWLYLDVILDLFSRRIIAWSTDPSPSGDLCTRTLRQALLERRPRPGFIHHSDRGATYTAHAYQELLAAHGGRASMSRRGNCWDNAVAESFFASMKVELDITGHGAYRTMEEARLEVLQYIEGFYNRRRLHSTLGYVSPNTYEDSPRAARAA
jgi:transposase InsO family protein